MLVWFSIQSQSSKTWCDEPLGIRLSTLRLKLVFFLADLALVSSRTALLKSLSSVPPSAAGSSLTVFFLAGGLAVVALAVVALDLAAVALDLAAVALRFLGGDGPRSDSIQW